MITYHHLIIQNTHYKSQTIIKTTKTFTSLTNDMLRITLLF